MGELYRHYLARVISVDYSSPASPTQSLAQICNIGIVALCFVQLRSRKCPCYSNLDDLIEELGSSETKQGWSRVTSLYWPLPITMKLNVL